MKIKANVVISDLRESSIRATLNFGHSVGHGIEGVMQPYLLHGECVSIGMLVEAVLARKMGYLQSSAIRRLHGLLHAIGLPTEIPHHVCLSLPLSLSL